MLSTAPPAIAMAFGSTADSYLDGNGDARACGEGQVQVLLGNLSHVACAAGSLASSHQPELLQCIDALICSIKPPCG